MYTKINSFEQDRGLCNWHNALVNVVNPVFLSKFGIKLFLKCGINNRSKLILSKQLTRCNNKKFY